MAEACDEVRVRMYVLANPVAGDGLVPGRNCCKGVRPPSSIVVSQLVDPSKAPVRLGGWRLRAESSFQRLNVGAKCD